jgi:Asp-tRNA(Asn)/Glu-tRNA(Gln) amidotransferase A subunit family amidase
MLSVLSERLFARSPVKGSLRVAWCPRPEGRPVDPGIAAVVTRAARQLSALGHDVEEIDIPVQGWREAFGPLVLEEEGRLRGNLLHDSRELLTDYELASLEAAASLDAASVVRAREQCQLFRARMDAFLARHDVIVTPTTAVTAFSIGDRPRAIAGETVDALWGAFPFTAAFNVAATPAASIPCGFINGLPVGVQLICARGRDALLLDIAEGLEECLDLDPSSVMRSFADERAAQAV